MIRKLKTIKCSECGKIFFTTEFKQLTYYQALKSKGIRTKYDKMCEECFNKLTEEQRKEVQQKILEGFKDKGAVHKTALDGKPEKALPVANSSEQSPQKSKPIEKKGTREVYIKGGRKW